MSPAGSNEHVLEAVQRRLDGIRKVDGFDNDFGSTKIARLTHSRDRS
jgi:hypothetical protein